MNRIDRRKPVGARNRSPQGVINENSSRSARRRPGARIRGKFFLPYPHQPTRTLGAATTRVSEAEQNAQRRSGQIEELSAVSNAARGGAKAAKESADEARQGADTANAGVQAANERITSIDEYQVKDTAVVNFRAGSPVLSKEAQAELDKIAQDAKNERAYIIEVTGFASAEGGKALNQRLSQRRADQVIRYLAENYDIPLRRFATPMGLGSTRPVADNSTRDGGRENRRGEVKVLVNRGLAANNTSAANPQK